MVTTFEQGWAARPFKVQFPQLNDEEAAYLDKINEAVTVLYMADMLPDSQRDSIRTKKMPREVSRLLKQAAKRAASAAQGEA